MDFNLTQEQLQICEEIRKVCKDFRTPIGARSTAKRLSRSLS
jgi:hypothetical protein